MSQSRRMRGEASSWWRNSRELEMGSKEVLDLIDQIGDSAAAQLKRRSRPLPSSSGINPKRSSTSGGAGAKAPEYPEISMTMKASPRRAIGLNDDLTHVRQGGGATTSSSGNFNRCEASYERILQIVPDNVHSASATSAS